MKTDAQIRSHVMRRVYAMYYARMLAKPATRFGAVGALVVTLANSISITSIAANILAVGGLTGFANFILVAFVSTTVLVQGVTIALLALVGWFTIDAFKRVKRVVVPQGEPATFQ
mgnify:CR=1 FL=1